MAAQWIMIPPGDFVLGETHFVRFDRLAVLVVDALELELKCLCHPTFFSPVLPSIEGDGTNQRLLMVTHGFERLPVALPVGDPILSPVRLR